MTAAQTTQNQPRRTRATGSACPVCQADPRPLREAPALDAWLCKRCGHTFVATLPGDDELDAVYSKYGYDVVTLDDLPAFLDAIIDDLLVTFEPYKKTRRLLDVGFGSGGLLRNAQKKGWDTFGVELSGAAVEAGNARKLGTLHHGDYLTAPLEPASFDVIVMSELIEHLLDPMPFLRRSAELLRSGGLLFMTTPHGRGVSGRALGASWSVLRPPEHLQLFSIDSMRRSARSAGFSRVDVTTQGLMPHELVAKLRARLKPRANGDAPPREFRERVERTIELNQQLSERRLGRAVKRAANVILGATSLGDSMRVRAVR